MKTDQNQEQGSDNCVSLTLRNLAVQYQVLPTLPFSP